MLIENNSLFKQLLGIARGNDFAHAGEAEAIDLMFDKLPKNPDQLILDVGSGLGETAQYIQSHEWGKVVGIEIDHDTVEYAKTYFPEVEFYQTDVNDIDSVLTEHPDVIVLFNVLYALLDQVHSLEVLREIAKPDTVLGLFIYLDRGDYKNSEPQAFQLARPIPEQELDDVLTRAGWHIEEMIDLNEKYEEWYQQFVNRIKQKREKIIDRSDEESFDYLVKKYTHLLDEVKAKTLGGAIVYAKPIA